MRVLVFGAALVCVCAAHSQLYVERIKQRNSHLSHPPAPQNPPLSDLYAAGSQSQYTQLYGGASQDSYQQLYGSSGQQQQQQRGSGGGGYGRPEPEDDDEYQPGYGQPVPTRAPPSKRPISYPRPSDSQNNVRTTRQPWSHQQNIQHRQPVTSYPQPQRFSTTRRPISYPRPSARTTTTRRPNGYPSADPEDLETPGYGKPPKRTEQPAYPQPNYPKPTPPRKPVSNGGYGNDLDDLEQPAYGGRQPTTTPSKQPSGGGYGNADLDEIETGGYGGPARQTQGIYGAQQLYPAESQVVSRRQASSGYNAARELPSPDALVQGSFFESRSNPDYFPSTPWSSPSVAPVPTFQLQSVQQPLGYLVVDHATHQW